jgi:hypothetical protein
MRSTITSIQQYAKDLSHIINKGVYSSRDDYDKIFEEAEIWLTDIIKRDPPLTREKEYCEICNNKGLEAHHAAGRKHDDRTIMVCEQCHRTLSKWQKTWGNDWERGDQPERLREAFFLLGLRDILRLKSKKTSNSIYESMADNLTEDISRLLKGD